MTHRETITVKGKAESIPWAFQDPKVEGRAAKLHGIPYPGTASGKHVKQPQEEVKDHAE